MDKKVKVLLDSNEDGKNDLQSHRKIVYYTSDYEDNVTERNGDGKSENKGLEEEEIKRKIPAGKTGVLAASKPALLSKATPIQPNVVAGIDTKIINLFVALSSNDPQSRLESFKKLNELKAVPYIRKELKTSIFKEALRVLSGLPMGKLELNSITLDLLRLAYRDSDWLVRCEALKVLEVTINQSSPFQWNQLKSLLAVEQPDHVRDPYDVLSSLPKSFKPNEIVFAVLSFIAANDTHHQVRLIAMELLGKVPGRLGKFLIVQSVKKDQCKWDLEDSNKTSKKRNSLMEFPLLCCGVFAHGIEDQFVKIRFSSLKSLFSLLISHQNASEACEMIHLGVFLDALLDECDLIRLTALKLLGRVGDLPLTVNFGLESLLAVLDDQNCEIRLEALNLLQTSLTVASGVKGAIVNETMLRSWRCLEAAVLKYPEMEGEAMEAALKLIQRLGSDFLMKKCPEFCAILLQTGNPKFLVPPSILGKDPTSPTISAIQLIMQIPFLKDKTAAQVRLVKIASRLGSVKCLNFLREFKGIYVEIDYEVDDDEPEIVCKDIGQVKLFQDLVNKISS